MTGTELTGRCTKVLYNVDEQRWRVGVRLLIHALGLLVLGVIVSHGARVLAAGVVTIRALLTLVVLAVTIVCAVALDHRAPAELGLRLRRGFGLDLAYGIGVGFAAIALIAIIEARVGWAAYRWARLDPATRAEGLAELTLFFMAVALGEEIVSRGYHLRNLAEAFAWLGSPRRATFAAVIVSSLIFGAIHSLNPSVSVLAILNIAFGGVLLATGAILQGDLAIPIGVHFGWNAAQAMWGMPVSGIRLWDSASLYSRAELGPDLMTGGEFGPEAGFEGLLGMAFGISMTIAWAKVRGGWRSQQPRFGTVFEHSS